MTKEELAEYIAEKERAEAEEARAEAEVARARQPLGPVQIRELLIRYFEGPITDEHVERLSTMFETERDKWRPCHQASFEGLIEWQGYAWKEEVSENRRYMAPIDHVLLMGHVLHRAFPNMNDKPFPAPKLYCPDVFVGVWEQLKPQPAKERILWHLGKDGSFRSNSPDLPAQYPRWCVNRSYGFAEPSYTFKFKTDDSEAAWEIYTVTVTPREFVGHAWDEREFRLRRVK